MSQGVCVDQTGAHQHGSRARQTGWDPWVEPGWNNADDNELGALVANDSGGPADLVILGAGSGGYAAALRAAELGMRVVMIERDKVGGTCLHRGCIPTKALLHSAETVDVIKEASQFGVNGTFESVDMAAVNAYKGKVVEGLYKGLTG